MRDPFESLVSAFRYALDAAAAREVTVFSSQFKRARCAGSYSLNLSGVLLQLVSVVEAGFAGPRPDVHPLAHMAAKNGNDSTRHTVLFL
jgi:hypothetical protein